jgi:flagellar biosynthesis GTPase FlhF
MENTKVATKLAEHFLAQTTKKIINPIQKTLGESSLIQSMVKGAKGTAAGMSKMVRKSYAEADKIVNKSVKQLDLLGKIIHYHL